MKRLLTAFATLALAASAIGAPEAPRQLDKANVLPLALDDAFQFRKTKIFLNEPELFKPTTDPMIAFERARVNFGAVNAYDRSQRYGQYFTFFWRSKRKADLTVRFEFRQQRLGSYVQARELFYPAAKGTVQSDFAVIGDDYREDGKITSWRALLIENGRIVGLTQSFLWN
jgi:hypothetical protein